MPRARLLLVFALLLVLPGIPGVARAQQARIEVLTPAGLNACGIDQAAFTQMTFIVRVQQTYPFTSVRFKLNMPGNYAIGGMGSPFSVTGNIATGVTITLPGCQTTGAVDVLTFTVFALSAASQVTWYVQPADGDPDILMTDCDGFPMTGASANGGFQCGDTNPFLAPYRPDPPDGTIGVPIDVMLSYVGDGNEIYLQTDPPPATSLQDIFCSVWGGTEFLPDVPNCGAKPHSVGQLQPNTTYYWQVNNVCGPPCELGAFGKVWSFTTGDIPLATEETTWGRVKALYRD